MNATTDIKSGVTSCVLFTGWFLDALRLQCTVALSTRQREKARQTFVGVYGDGDNKTGVVDENDSEDGEARSSFRCLFENQTFVSSNSSGNSSK